MKPSENIKPSYVSESSDDDSPKDNDFVDFTQCEKSLLVKDVRWMDVFGFFFLGLCNSLLFVLLTIIARHRNWEILKQYMPLEADNEKMTFITPEEIVYPTIEDIYNRTWPDILAKIISPFFPLWTRFVIISWFVGNSLGDLLPSLAMAIDPLFVMRALGTKMPYGLFLLLPSLVAITFFFGLTDVEPLVPCTRIWNSTCQWIVVCVLSLHNKSKGIHKGWYYMVNMFLGYTLLSIMGHYEKMLLVIIKPSFVETSPKLAPYVICGCFVSRLIGCVFSGILSFVEVYFPNLIALGILVFVTQIKRLMTNLPLLVPLMFLFQVSVGAVIPIIFYQLRLDDGFNPSKMQFLYGILSLIWSLASLIGYKIQDLITAGD